MVVPSRIRLLGPLAPHRDGLWADLLANGYSPLTASKIFHLTAHLSRWMEAQGVEPADMDSACVNEFLQHRTESGYTNRRSRRGLEPVLRHLRRVGAVPMPKPIKNQTGLDVLLGEYQGYLVRERALSASTTPGYLRIARQFLSSAFSMKSLDLDRLTPAGVTSFILRESRSSSVGYAKVKVTALRSLLRYLHVRGDITRELAAAVPAVAGWRLAGIPKSLTPGEVAKILGSCDRRTSVGRRDIAALLLMVRLGLRAGEVAALCLDDIDWHAGELVIRGKPRREDRLPLPQEVGEAIVSYLKRRGPRSTSRQLFLRVRAPQDGLSPGAVKAIVRKAGRRIGLNPLGAHRLRHTAATQMLRTGASLPQIALALRHRHIDTTAIYAKVDRNRLRTVARPWPGGKR